MELLILFIVLNVVNVITQTIKSIATIKCGKGMAAIVNAVVFGLYTVVLVYMNCDLDLWAKVLVVAGSNLVGVYVVKLLEEKSRKDKLWKIEATIFDKEIFEELKRNQISCNMIPTSVDGQYMVNCFCKTQAESKNAFEILEANGAKFFVSETKIF